MFQVTLENAGCDPELYIRLPRADLLQTVLPKLSAPAARPGKLGETSHDDFATNRKAGASGHEDVPEGDTAELS